MATIAGRPAGQRRRARHGGRAGTRPQVGVQMKASSICGSDIRAIYREHLGTGAEAYQGVIAGHEPCGQVVAVGPATKAARGRRQGHDLSHCGLQVCEECRHGYMIGCSSPHRAAHGWQRDGGHAEYLLAEATCILRRAVDVRRRRARVVRLRDGVRRPAAPPTVGAGPSRSSRGSGRSGSLPPCSAARWVPVRSSAPTSPAAPAHGARRRPRRPRRRRRGRGAGDRRAPHRRPGLRGEHRLLRQRRSACPRAREHRTWVAARSSARVARCRSRCPTC